MLARITTSPKLLPLVTHQDKIMSVSVAFFVLTLSVAFAHHHHDHESEHLQAISGNCDKLAPLRIVDPETLNAITWIVHNDSYIEDPDEACQTLSLRHEDGILHTSENIQTGGSKSWNVRNQWKPDETRKGYYVGDDGEIAVIFTADDKNEVLCFTECGRLKGRDGFGAHFACGTINGKITPEQLKLIDDAYKKLQEQGIDLNFYSLKVNCDID